MPIGKFAQSWRRASHPHTKHKYLKSERWVGSIQTLNVVRQQIHTNDHGCWVQRKHQLQSTQIGTSTSLIDKLGCLQWPMETETPPTARRCRRWVRWLVNRRTKPRRAVSHGGHSCRHLWEYKRCCSAEIWIQWPVISTSIPIPKTVWCVVN